MRGLVIAVVCLFATSATGEELTPNATDLPRGGVYVAYIRWDRIATNMVLIDYECAFRL